MIAMDTAQDEVEKSTNKFEKKDAEETKENVELTPQQTEGQGDCAFHASFGVWDPFLQRYTCPNVAILRKQVADEIRSGTKSRANRAIKEAMQQMIIAERHGGKAFGIAREKFQKFSTHHESIIQQAWQEFEKELITCPEIMEFVNSHVPTGRDLKNKVFICLQNKENELYGMILSLENLHKKYKSYTEITTQGFDWDTLLQDKELREEYAELMERAVGQRAGGYWLLPGELEIIAIVLNITIELHITDGKTKKRRILETYNLEAQGTQKVPIYFNGRNHYERMVSKPKLELAERLSTVEQEWMASINQNVDDSSDEEDVAVTLGKYDFDKVNIGNVETVLPYIAATAALNLYWSDEVSKRYYPEKRRLLSGNQLFADELVIAEWVEESLKELASNQFQMPELSKFFQRYSENLKSDFQICNDASGDYDWLVNNFVDFFVENPGCLLKIAQHGDLETLPLELYELIEDLFNHFFGYFDGFDEFDFYMYEEYEEMDYENSLVVSSQILAKELTADFWDDARDRIGSYLKRMGIIGGDGQFLPSQDRKKLIDRIRRQEKDPFYLEVLNIVFNCSHRSNMPINFLNGFQLTFLELYFDNLLLAEKERKHIVECSPPTSTMGIRSRTYYSIVPGEGKEFGDSFFGCLERRFRIAFNNKKNSLKKLDLFKEFAVILKHNKNEYFKNMTLERVTLGSNFGYGMKDILDILVYSRLVARSQTRLVRQKTDDAQKVSSPESKLSEETVVRSLTFPSLGTTGLETQNISINGVRTDKVLNMKKYQKVYEDLFRVMELTKVDDKMVAIWVRKTLKGEVDGVFTHLEPPRRRIVGHFIANLTYLLFVTETARNPSCWVVHQMLLDLVIKGELIWKQALTATPENNYRSIMPMAISDAVKGGRYLSERGKLGMVRRYLYQGDSDQGLGENIDRAEVNLISRWFAKCALKPITPLLTFQEATREICENIERWYGVKIVPNFKNRNVDSFEQSRDLVIAYRQKKLEHLLDGFWGRQIYGEPCNRSRVVAQYCF